MSRRTERAKLAERLALQGHARTLPRPQVPQRGDDLLAMTGLDASAVVDGTFPGDVTFQGIVSVADATGASTIILDPSVGLSSAAVSSAAGTALTDATWTHLTKALNTSRASTTTPTLDPDLQFATVAGTTYQFVLIMTYAQASAGTVDMLTVSGEDATARGFVVLAATPSTFAVGTTQTTLTSTVNTGTAKWTAMMWGAHVGGGGTFGVLWSQNTSSVINLTVYKAGSGLFYRAL